MLRSSVRMMRGFLSALAIGRVATISAANQMKPSRAWIAAR